MRQAVVTSPGVVELQHADTPTPADGEVVVRARLVGICGSDVHAFHGRHPFVPLPYRPGHEIYGTVESSRDGSRLVPGTRVVIEPILACGTCKYCRDGRYNLCATMTFFGCTAPGGGLAEWFAIPEDRAVPIPDELSDDLAVLVEPLSTPVHAVRLAAGSSTARSGAIGNSTAGNNAAGNNAAGSSATADSARDSSGTGNSGDRGGELAGQTVAILGAGTIGLLTLIAARHAGAARIAVSDLSPAKRDRAARLGADSVHDGADPGMVDAIRDDLGTSADIVFDCVSVQSSVDQAIAIAVKGGTVVVVGVPAAPVTVPLPEIQDLQVRVQGSATYTRDDIEQAISMLAAGVVDPADIITARYPLAKVDEAFAAASSGEHVKVVVTADH
ncbi:alcohol dehydrogenase catalytic domain-containing protein [Actinoplanes sp. NPDC051470]|uniref:zinc-dependent alcohol dehydrogenase n=1 Tax=Actinoplanes sp. NPDC051470 TaxID=3157224 RepID=UPI0034421BDE